MCAYPAPEPIPFWDLYGTIFHQGTRYQASAHAVPFLFEVLAAPDTAERDQLVGLLASIAIGYDESWLPQGCAIAEHRARAVVGAELLAARMSFANFSAFIWDYGLPDSPEGMRELLQPS